MDKLQRIARTLKMHSELLLLLVLLTCMQTSDVLANAHTAQQKQRQQNIPSIEFNVNNDINSIHRNRFVRAAMNIDANENVAAHSLVDNPHCTELQTLCAHLKSMDNLSMLECVATFTSSQLEALPDLCQHAIWQEQRTMLQTDWLQNKLISRHCPTHKDQLISCVNAVDVYTCIKERIEELPHNDNCRTQVLRVMATFPTDFETLGGFFTACGTVVEQLQCGRLNIERKSLSQLETLQCLLENRAELLNAECKSAVKVLDQQRADMEFHETCSMDLQRLCGSDQMGINAAFKCLLKNKNNPAMTRACGDLLVRHGDEIAHDYRAAHGLAKACKDDIKQYHCRRGVSEDKHVRLAQILLCLESVTKNGTQLASKCRAEIDDHRRMLMQDYHLSPEILNDCADDIPKFCGDIQRLQSLASGGGVGAAGGGEIIHCLMENARMKRRKDRRVTAQCQRSLEALIKVSDAGEDWRVDPVLRNACKPVVDVACTDTLGGEARVISCLIEHIGTPLMQPDCEQALLLIQYFVARDFKLDPQLYKNCHDDAIKYCNAKRAWDDVTGNQMDPERGPLVLPCLHRIAYSDGKPQLRKNCFKEVKRVMRQRAISVDLMPEVEDACIEDLAVRCAERTERGAEMECLQNNLEKLQPECKNVVETFTEEEAANVELNPVIMSVCMEAMKTHCNDILNGGREAGDMMDCLISHKNDPDLRQNLKCRAAIEHFQIISLKNYHFTYKFKEACRPHVARFCTASTTKNEVVACLSEVIRNDTLKNSRQSIPKECRQQVKSQLYQQRESMLLNPKLANACKKEIELFCPDKKGPGQSIECLIANTARLGNSCHHAVFLVKRSELGDSDTDYTLVNTCREMTYKYCTNAVSTNLLECLKTYRDEPGFDQRCHLVIVNRMIEQNTDYRFNPTLQLACGKNIDQYCAGIVATAQPNEELNGKVVQCLKNKFRENRLDSECEQEMIKILHEQALNYKLNPLLQNLCKSEIEVLCKPFIKEEEHGLVEECLKTAFLNQKIFTRDCKIEVVTLIEETKADIHVDPILEEACAVDLLRYCLNERSGNGRKLKCLQTVLRDHSKAMEEDCRVKLQRRIEMFRNAEPVLAQPPENMRQLVDQVVTSPAKKFFIVILMTAVGMVFIMGIFLGRVTKRAMNTKNK